MTKLTGDGTPEALNRMAREEMKLKLLTDIRTDLIVCELEGWDKSEYLADLHATIARFHPCEKMPK